MNNTPLRYAAMEDSGLPEKLIFGNRPLLLLIFLVVTVFLT